MSLMTKEDIMVAPVLLCDLSGRDSCPTDGPLDGGAALTNPQEFTPTCPLCNKEVLLETCKADEQGRAVHEDCYAQKITLHQPSQPPLES
jgi:hypothetical protein